LDYIHFLYLIFLHATSYNQIHLHDGSIDANKTMPDFANDVYVQSSSMAAQLIQSGYANTVMPYMNMYGNSSIVGAPYIQGGYTNLLLGVDRAATSQQAVKKLNFEE